MQVPDEVEFEIFQFLFKSFLISCWSGLEIRISGKVIQIPGDSLSELLCYSLHVPIIFYTEVDLRAPPGQRTMP